MDLFFLISGLLGLIFFGFPFNALEEFLIFILSFVIELIGAWFLFHNPEVRMLIFVGTGILVFLRFWILRKK